MGSHQISARFIKISPNAKLIYDEDGKIIGVKGIIHYHPKDLVKVNHIQKEGIDYLIEKENKEKEVKG
jgi:hypothetical protein